MNREERLKSISEELGSYRSFFGLCADLASVENNWPSIAGDAVARRSLPRSFKDGVLIVVVENKLVQQDINFKKNAIINGINTNTALAIKDIRAEVGLPLRKTGTCGRDAWKRRKKRVQIVAKETELEHVKNEIMERHPALGEELAAAIARCRISGYKARQK
ncbi:MAG: DUF721 domain-containing protein [Synergistaceae bacterium]|nr:DUF721 domain-containing protein [Synergistaceae bacterium]